jgi:flagellin-like hook-associated protein FlgL
MVTRIATAANNDAIVARMLAQQSRINDYQQQVSTGFKSQDYVGIASDSFRLLNIEGQQTRLQAYTNNNLSTITTLQTQATSVQAINEQALDIRSELVTLSGQDFSSKSPANVQTIQDIQTKAFAALNQIAYFLNQKVDGKYVFGGARNDQQPVDFPYGSLDQFQQTFDGISTVFPTTRVSDMVNIGFNNVGVSYSAPQTIGSDSYTQISAAPGSFITQTLGTAAFDSLNFTNVGSNGKITASSPGAFRSLQVGQTISIDNTAGSTGNNGIYTITAVSPDGNTITLDQNVQAGVEPTGTPATINLLVPNGTAMAMSGSANGNNRAYTVHWPSNADLTAAGFDFTTDNAIPADGSSLFVDPTVFNTTPETISLNSTAFLTGTAVPTTQKISDTQTISLDITGLDPAFEKVIRGLGVIAQGDLLDNPDRLTQALGFINDGIEHSSLEPTELQSDLTSVQNKIALNLKTLTDTNDQHNQLLAFLETRQNDIEKADTTETAVRLNAESSALQISYATLAKIQDLSLLNYL